MTVSLEHVCDLFLPRLPRCILFKLPRFNVDPCNPPIATRRRVNAIQQQHDVMIVPVVLMQCSSYLGAAVFVFFFWGGDGDGVSFGR